MSATVPSYRWSASEFVRSWGAGAFDHQMELIEGELWPVVIGDWHGEVVTRLSRRRVGSEPIETVGSRL